MNDGELIPGEGTQVQKGAAPALRISRKKGSLLKPPHVKEGYFFVPRYKVWGGGGIPLQSTLTPSDARNQWASQSAAATAAAKQVENVIIKS